MYGFDIGDRVIINNSKPIYLDYNSDISLGMEGTVVHLEGSDVGVEFDRCVEGHSCDGRGKYRYCWYVKPECLSNLSKSLPELDIYGLI